MASKSVTFTPAVNQRTRENPEGKMGFKSDTHDFVFFSETNEIHFRVGADVTLNKGCYYIDWTIAEVPWKSDQPKYHAPARTMVEVVAAVTDKYSFAVTSFAGGIIYKGTSSPFLKVSVSNSPYSDVKVVPAMATANDKVTFSPTELSFGPDDTEKFFLIQVAADYDLEVTGNNLS